MEAPAEATDTLEDRALMAVCDAYENGGGTDEAFAAAIADFARAELARIREAVEGLESCGDGRGFPEDDAVNRFAVLAIIDTATGGGE
jgi:hypothetical protein